MNRKDVIPTTTLPPRRDPPVGMPAPPLTHEERLQRIEAMGQRINSYIRFMCDVAALNNASAEVKERGVAEFYEQLRVVEKQLGRIHDAFRLE